MDTKRFAVGTVVGGVVLFATGYLIFQMTFNGFYAANVGSATGVDRSTPIFWATAVANLAYAALVTYVIGSRAEQASAAAGFRIGAIVGCLAWATSDFILYGTTNVANLTRVIVDPLLELVRGGVAGAAIVIAVRALAPVPRTVSATH